MRRFRTNNYATTVEIRKPEQAARHAYLSTISNTPRPPVQEHTDTNLEAVPPLHREAGRLRGRKEWNERWREERMIKGVGREMKKRVRRVVKNGVRRERVKKGCGEINGRMMRNKRSEERDEKE